MQETAFEGASLSMMEAAALTIMYHGDSQFIFLSSSCGFPLQR